MNKIIDAYQWLFFSPETKRFRRLWVRSMLSPGLDLVLVAIVIAALFCAPAFAADSGACYSIGNADARAYCLAKAHREPSQCYSIQSADLRAMCLAEVRR